MQLGEALAELELVAVDHDGAVSAFLALHCVGRQTVGIDAQEIAYPGLFQFKEACHTVVRHDVNHAVLHRSEDPLQHVVEVDTDVGGHAAAFVYIALPRRVIPLAARSDVGEVHIIHLVLGAFGHLLLQCDDAVVQAQLEDGVGLVAGFLFHPYEVVDVIRV